MYCFRADDVWGYKLIYFVLHWMKFCIPFDDVLRNKLIYFVPDALIKRKASMQESGTCC